MAGCCLAKRDDVSKYDPGGEGGIRTHGTLLFSSFQDYRDRPLCHLSKEVRILSYLAGFKQALKGRSNYRPQSGCKSLK